jgi:hypothetical protein
VLLQIGSCLLFIPLKIHERSIALQLSAVMGH